MTEDNKRGLGWLMWVRALPPSLVWGICVVLSAAVVGILAAFNAPSWPRFAAIVLGLAVGVASELDKWQTKRREEQKTQQQEREAATAKEAEWQQQAQGCLRLWPLPTLADADPHTLGVTRSFLAQAHTPGGEVLSPYVRRDIDQLALKRLRAQGLLLLIGAPTSGASRTAYQVARADSDRRLVLAPNPPHGLKTALDELDVLSRLAPSAKLLIWLDRVDEFSPAGLTATMLDRCRQRLPGLRVVATIPSTYYAAWASEQPNIAEVFGDPVVLERLATPGELQRAQEAYPGVDFGEGIAATFTAVAALLRRLRAGNPACPFEPGGGDCTLARPVVEVAIDWRCTDTPRPMPMARLNELIGQRLGESQQPKVSHLVHVLQWAADPVMQGAALLSVQGDDRGEQVITAHGDIVEIRRSEATEPPPEPLWMTALDDAQVAGDSEALGRIGFRAHVDGQQVIAVRAWARVTALGEPAAHWLELAAAFSRRRHEPIAERAPRERLLKLTEQLSGPDSMETAAAVKELAIVCSMLGDSTEALELWTRALRIQERELGPDDPEVAATLRGLGNLWLEMGWAVKAREILERALRIQEQVLDPDDPDVARTLNFLASTNHTLGRPDKAQELLERALRIGVLNFGPDDAEIVSILTNLGSASGDLGQLDKACAFYEWALRLKVQVYGPDDIRVAKTLNNLGSTLVDLNRIDSAREVLQRALRIREEKVGPVHLEVAITLNNLAAAYTKSGQLDEARKLLQRALRIQVRAVGVDHIAVAHTLTKMAAICMYLRRPDEAQKLFERALSIEERTFGVNHPQVVDNLNNLGAAWMLLGQSDKARQLFERALETLHAHFPKGHPTIRIVVENLRSVAPDSVPLDDGQIIDRSNMDRNVSP